MNDPKDVMVAEFEDVEARRQYAQELLNAYLSLQIKTLREQRGLSQSKLAKLAGKRQSQVSEMESIDHSSWTVASLNQIAAALDLALLVRFESFGTFLDECLRLDRGSLERPSFPDDPAFKAPGETAVATLPKWLGFGPPRSSKVKTETEGFGHFLSSDTPWMIMANDEAANDADAA